MEPKSVSGKHQMTTKNAAFFEMAGRIPGEIKVKKKGSDILIVAVGSDEKRGEAHFHVFKNKNDFENWKNGACLCFKENKYFDHDSHKEILAKDEIKVLMDILGSKPDESLPGNTYWQYLIYLWNGNNFDFRIDINTPIQGYDYDTITRYKEYSETRNNRGIDEEFLEMATIKWGFMSIKLAIYGDEGSGYPHFHFYKNLKPEEGVPASYRSGGGCLAIESTNYFVHGGHQEKLDSKEINGLITFLNEKNKTIDSITNWEYIIALWNDNNPEQKQLSMDLPIPDYRSDMDTVQEKLEEAVSSYLESHGYSDAVVSESRWDDYIPKGITDENQFFGEMAEIYPQYNKDNNIKSAGFRVCVFENKEGPIPHVHIYYEHKGETNHGTIKTVAYVRLDRAEYAPQHEDETKVLNSKERKNLVKFFSTEMPDVYGRDKNEKFYQRTCWEECVRHWIDENPGSEKYFDIDEETGRFIMPDYSEL